MCRQLSGLTPRHEGYNPTSHITPVIPLGHSVGSDETINWIPDYVDISLGDENGEKFSTGPGISLVLPETELESQEKL